jgi:hypothetical protein
MSDRVLPDKTTIRHPRLWVSVQIALHGDLINKVESLSANDLNINPTIRKASWILNKIQINRTNPPLPDKADNKIAKERNVNVNGASRKNKAVVSRAAVSKADDKTGCSLGTSERREVTPAAFFTSKHLSRGETILLCQKKKQSNARAKMSAKVSLPALKLASLCAKKWNTFERASTAPDRRNKRSRLVSRKRGGRE